MHTRNSGLIASRIMKLVLVAGTLCAALLVTMSFGIIPRFTAGKSGGGVGSPTTGQTGQANCGNSEQPAQPANHGYWVHIASTAPADVLAALTSAPDYMTPLQAASAASTSTYSFDAPVMVKPAFCESKNENNNFPHFIIRASIDGVRRITYDVPYDPAHLSIRISSVGGQTPPDPAYGKPFPFAGITSHAAAVNVQSARGIGLAAGYTPELVFFAPHPNLMPPHATIHWAGGGTDSAHPARRLKGTDGRLYFVGIDGAVYDPAQLPVEPNTILIQI